jgi:extracellular factor (EF) 3-hydroxypalmitic acid methyl ester biosynthesis protein
MHAESAVADRVRCAARQLAAQLAAIEAALVHGADNDRHYPALKQAVDACMVELWALELWGPVNRVLSSELWNIGGNLLARGRLVNQARIKPRGYAGDYEMLARIYEGRLCDDPLGRLLDRYFQEEAAPTAVRNRMRMMADWIVEAATHPHPGSLPEGEGELKVAIVGSAFGLEVRDALKRMSEGERQRVRLALLDLDPAAIDLARQQLAPLLPPQRLRAEGANVFRLAERPRLAAILDGADLLFCPGLFDYLDDSAAAAMLRLFYERLAPGGRMTVFQFAPHNPTRTYMEWLGNWYLLYRDAQELRQLVEAAGIPAAAATFGAEPLGVDLYVTARR